jgi:hypothetical protein
LRNLRGHRSDAAGNAEDQPEHTPPGPEPSNVVAASDDDAREILADDYCVAPFEEVN